MEPLKTPHWTSSTNSFVAKISGDFILQIEQKLDQENMNRAAFAAKLDVTEGSVSQTLKVALVAYDDGDPNNERGPINSEIFYECWKRAGRPIDFFDLALTPPQQSAGFQMVAIQSASGLEGNWFNGLEVAKKKPPERAQSRELSGDSNKVAGL
jgi:hypothetical protein